MRSTIAIGFAAILMAAPAMGQVIIQTPDPNAAMHEQRAQQDRADARMERQEAQRRADMGDYVGAAQAARDARADRQDARRQQDRADDAPATGVIISR